MNRTYSCYVIQLGQNQDVLYLSYSLNVQLSFNHFITRHTRLKHSQLRPELSGDFTGYHSSRQANRAALRLIDRLESQGFEVIAGGPLLLPYWQTYVIEIEGNPKHVYVGETNYPRVKRYQQHVYQFNCARELKRCDIFRLAEDLCDTQKYRTKPAALRAEAQLAHFLKLQGYLVKGGH